MSKTSRGLYEVTKRLPALLGLTAVTWVGYSMTRKRPDVPLPDPFASEHKTIESLSAGRIALHETSIHTDRDDQTPVLLVHSVNAAASAYEMAPLLQRMERDRFVAAMDLPGFGHSDRSSRDYTPELMTDGISAALDQIGRPTHVIALSLGCEFAARAARLRPDLVRSLTFISPTGMGSGSRVDPDHETAWDTVLANPVLGQAMFDLLTTDRSIRYFLGKSFSGAVDPGLATFASLSGRQPGGRHAPLAFLQGRLFTPDALSELYQPLMVPTLVLYDEDAYTDFAYLPEFIADGRGHRFAERITGTRGLPQFERPAVTVDAITRFWKDVESG